MRTAAPGDGNGNPMGWDENPRDWVSARPTGGTDPLQVSCWEGTELWGSLSLIHEGFPVGKGSWRNRGVCTGRAGAAPHRTGITALLPALRGISLGFRAVFLLAVPSSRRARAMPGCSVSGRFVCLFSCLLLCFCSVENPFSVPEAALPPCTLSHAGWPEIKKNQPEK